MTKRQTLLVWALSLLGLLIASSSPWVTSRLTQEVGTAEIQVSGLEVFPVIGALLLIQTAGFMVVLLVGQKFARLLSILLGLGTLWVSYLVGIGFVSLSKARISMEISSVIGITGADEQLGYISNTESSVWPYVFLVMAVGNIIILAVQGLSMRIAPSNNSVRAMSDSAEDLWENQSK